MYFICRAKSLISTSFILEEGGHGHAGAPSDTELFRGGGLAGDTCRPRYARVLPKAYGQGHQEDHHKSGAQTAFKDPGGDKNGDPVRDRGS